MNKNRENISQPSFAPAAMATGIGSLPFTDLNQAMELIKKYLPEIPHWPQLPRRGKIEHFVHQYLQPLISCGMLMPIGDSWRFDTSDESCAACMTDFYTLCLPAEDNDPDCMQSFLPPSEAAPGFHAFISEIQKGTFENAVYIKGQIAGPLSLSLELKDQNGRPAYYQDDLRDMLVRTLALNARSQAATMAATNLTPIIFVDDPAVKAFGSRLHLALNRETIIEDLNTIFTAIQQEGAITGVHSCEAVDWSLLLETKVEILSLDAYRFGDSLKAYAKPLRRFIENGGVVAWGIVPTLDDPFAESVDSLEQRLETLWDTLFEAGPDRSVVLKQSMITPACGAGLLTEAQAEQIYQLTANLANRLSNNPKLKT